MTKTIKSCGFIVFRRGPDAPLFLLIRSAAHGHWDFPKGHLDPGEDETTCALRELKEEAGIASIKTLPHFREQTHYSVSRGNQTFPKEVTYFLGEAQDGSVSVSGEHSEYTWASLERALGLVQFDNSRRLLSKAAGYLESETL